MAEIMVEKFRSTGAFKAASRLASATPPPAHVLSSGIGWQGIGILLNGLFGTLIGSTISVENVGLLGSNRIGSRRVIQVSAGFMIFFSMLGKFGALFASIPFPIFAAIYCVLFGLVASVGLSFLQFTNMNSMRNLFITGVALFLGLSILEYFREYTIRALHGPAHTKAGLYVPYVADSNRAMDEYTSEIFMGGKNTIVMHNTCEDSLLAAPIILDLVLLAEAENKFHSFHPVATILSYLTKAPLLHE